MPAIWSCSLLRGICGSTFERMHFRCVVSKHLRIFVPGGFFPSAGYLDRASGSQASVGSEGYCWSSFPSGTSAVFLNFDGSTTWPYVGSRGAGRSMRCVQGFANLVSGCFLPVCGVPGTWFRSAFGGRFFVLLLVRRRCRYRCPLSGCCRFGCDVGRCQLQDGVSFVALCPRSHMDRFSSRLRGTWIVRRERCRTSVPTGIFRARLLRVRMPGVRALPATTPT